MITVDYLKKTLGACWSEEQLTEAAKLWPANPTWSWFLGERIAAMTRAEAMLRLHVAASHMGVSNLQLGKRRPGGVLKFFRTCSDEQLDRGAALFGAWLDDQTDAARAALEAVLAEPVPAIVEAKP